MIAVSDAVLLLASATVLAVGVYRWQNNVEYVRQNDPVVQSSSSLATTNDSAVNESRPSGNQSLSQNTEQNAATDRPAVADNGAINNESGTVLSNQNTDSSASDDTTRIVDVQPVPITAINVNDDEATTAANRAITDAPTLAIYTVVSGDSLSQIAERFGTSVTVLRDINDIQGSLITVGQQLRYPLSAAN